jgi:hypothetical protein
MNFRSPDSPVRQHSGYRATGWAPPLLLCAAAITGCSQQTAGESNVTAGAAVAAKSPQGDTWDSIKLLPDWSGVWVLASGTAAAEDSFGTDGGRVPLTPKYLELRAVARATRAQQNYSFCLPAGTPGILQHGVMHEYLFTPGRVTMLIEDGEVRRIYTDGRAHRSLEEMRASFMGDSVGHWEGDTLVVDTIGFPRGTLFQNHGLLATRNSHLVERIFRNDQDQMQIDSVLTDPEIFAIPYRYSRYYRRSPIPLIETSCSAGNRDTGESVDLTPPPEDQ